MPRPKQGYTNSAGQPIPGVGDINGRFMDRSRLLYWAFNRGKEGRKKLYDDSDINIGTAVHNMAEADLRGDPQKDIDYYFGVTFPDPEERAKAERSFAAFKEWRREFHVRPYAQEVSLVSERLQVGGTLDTVAVIRNGLGLVEFKTSAEVYEDHLMQMGAYSLLWEECHPKEPLTSGYHLILLPKDGAPSRHREYTLEALTPFRAKFKLYRQAYDLDQVCNSKKVLAGITVAPSHEPPKQLNAPKYGTIAEMLRAHGHIKEAA